MTTDVRGDCSRQREPGLMTKMRLFHGRKSGLMTTDVRRKLFQLKGAWTDDEDDVPDKGSLD